MSLTPTPDLLPAEGKPYCTLILVLRRLTQPFVTCQPRPRPQSSWMAFRPSSHLPPLSLLSSLASSSIAFSRKRPGVQSAIATSRLALHQRDSGRSKTSRTPSPQHHSKLIPSALIEMPNLKTCHRPVELSEQDSDLGNGTDLSQEQPS